ncbi:hypothetical protein O6H91_07G100000 [Diphasiastrum complanatum]|uniref:Uncharacterized protein n=1 Tax=Diphasiastrum complanatum TaxID=34168 RepID=A0ACC2D895_DIPCM|nr:hypothetical protein O6H91_07G100000 [Diphasiastrum complanatum]
MSSRHPEIVWAQHSDKVYLTVALPDAKNPKVKLEPEGKFIFSASAGPEDYLYVTELDLYDKVNVEASKISVGPRHIFIVIQKGEKVWWKRLLKSEGRTPPYIKVDWDRWVDEDDNEEQETSKFDNFDLGGMDDFSKFGAGGEADDDDEELAESEPEPQSKPVEEPEIHA